MSEKIGTLPIKWLNDANGDKFFPVTNTKSVIDDEGVGLDVIIGSLENRENNNGILSIQKNGTTIGTFGADEAKNKSVDIPVPVELNDLSDVTITRPAFNDILVYNDKKGIESFVNTSIDADFIPDGLSKKMMTTAERTKLSGIAAGAEVNVQSDWNQTTTTADDFIKNKPVLATVATSGSYDDLTDKPVLATVATSGSYDDLTDKPDMTAIIIRTWSNTQ